MTMEAESEGYKRTKLKLMRLLLGLDTKSRPI